MSPARSKRQPVPHKHSRTDIIKAVAIGAGIVLATGVIVWLLRPGPVGIPGTGGIMNRQPRASWLVVGAIAAGAASAWFILRGGPRARSRAKILLPVALGVVLVATVAGGVAWPGGLLRHDVAPAPPPKTPETTTTKPGAQATTPTTVAGGSGSIASTPTSGVTPISVVPGSTTATTPAATTPATGPPTTGSP